MTGPPAGPDPERRPRDLAGHGEEIRCPARSFAITCFDSPPPGARPVLWLPVSVSHRKAWGTHELKPPLDPQHLGLSTGAYCIESGS